MSALQRAGATCSARPPCRCQTRNLSESGEHTHLQVDQRGATLICLREAPGRQHVGCSREKAGRAEKQSVTKQLLVKRGFLPLVVGIVGMSYALAGRPQGGEADWSFNATIIEACGRPNPC